VSAFYCVVLSSVGRGLASGWSPVQGVLPTVQPMLKIQKINSEPEQAKRPDPWKTMIIKFLLPNIAGPWSNLGWGSSFPSVSVCERGWWFHRDFTQCLQTVTEIVP
jgi:hypothetical protein